MRQAVRASVVLFVVAVAWVAPGGMASAQTSTTTVTTSGGSSLVSQHDAIPALLWALGFGLLAIIFVLVFLYLDRSRSIGVVATLASLGIATNTEEEAVLAPQSGPLQTRTTTSSAPADAIKGTASLTKGSSAAYQLVPDAEPGSITWVVNGPGKIDPPNDTHTTLTTSDVGSVTLKVTYTAKGETGETSSTKTINVVSTVAAQDLINKVPFLGSGFGTVIILLAVASVTAALGLTNVLNGEAVAGILASVVTYSVAKAAGAAGGSGAGTGTGTSTGTGKSGSGTGSNNSDD